MFTRQKVIEGIGALKGIATKETTNPDPNAAVAEVLGIETEVVARIVAGSSTESDLIEAAAGIVRLAAQVKPEGGGAPQVAAKSFGDILEEDPDDGRDFFGRKIRTYSGKLTAKKSERPDNSKRDLFGRRIRKVCN